MTSSSTTLGLPDALADAVPLVGRAAELDPRCLARVRSEDGELLTILVRLPFAVLAGRTVRAAVRPVDATYAAGELLRWLDAGGEVPVRRDGDWRWAAPPRSGWRRVDTVPGATVRRLVALGGRTVADLLAAAAPGATLRPQVTEALLDSVVIRASGADSEVAVTLRHLSAAVRLGFVPASSNLNIDIRGRWTRLAGAYGAVFAERPGAGLTLI